MCFVEILYPSSCATSLDIVAAGVISVLGSGGMGGEGGGIYMVRIYICVQSDSLGYKTGKRNPEDLRRTAV